MSETRRWTIYVCCECGEVAEAPCLHPSVATSEVEVVPLSLLNEALEAMDRIGGGDPGRGHAQAALLARLAREAAQRIRQQLSPEDCDVRGGEPMAEGSAANRTGRVPRPPQAPHVAVDIRGTHNSRRVSLSPEDSA